MNRYDPFVKGKLYKLKEDAVFFDKNNETLLLKKDGLVVYLNDENYKGYYHKYHVFYSIEQNGVFTTSWRENVVEI